MTFDDLINKKMPEDEIFERAAEILQENFAKYQDVFVCLELGAAEGPTRRAICFVRAVRFYKNNCPVQQHARCVFMYHCEFEKVYLITRFIEGCYRTTLKGHFVTIRADIYQNNLNEITVYKSETDRVTHEQIPYDIVVGAFREISAAVLEERKKAS
ncbi:MAG: hypothetical protein ABL927_02285 [Bdellovibrionales bacterium]